MFATTKLTKVSQVVFACFLFKFKSKENNGVPKDFSFTCSHENYTYTNLGISSRAIVHIKILIAKMNF